MYAEILIVVMMMNFSFVMSTPTFNCKLPVGCEINDIQFIINYGGYEKTTIEYPGILCDIRNETYQFDYPTSSPLLKPKQGCHISSNFKATHDIMEFRFPSNYILSKQFNFQKLSDYTWYFTSDIDTNFMNLIGFELDITNEQNISNHDYFTDESYFSFECIRCKIEFYSNGRHIKKCQDILDLYPNGNINSLFQFHTYFPELRIKLFHSEYKTPLCPVLFNNSDIYSFFLIGLIDTFYKRNILSIENRTFDDLNSTIKLLSVRKAENINIDSNLLNPSVFRDLTWIYLSGSINKIDGNSLKCLNNLLEIQIVKNDYRDIIHKNGIKWIRDLNANIDVNLSNVSIDNSSTFDQFIEYFRNQKKMIEIGFFDSKTEIRSSKLFPDEDFCLYKDFPFNQLVILMEFADFNTIALLRNKNKHFSCTYLWLAQYFHLFIKLD